MSSLDDPRFGRYRARLAGELGEALAASIAARPLSADIMICKRIRIGVQDLVAAEAALTKLKPA